MHVGCEAVAVPGDREAVSWIDTTTWTLERKPVRHLLVPVNHRIEAQVHEREIARRKKESHTFTFYFRISSFQPKFLDHVVCGVVENQRTVEAALEPRVPTVEWVNADVLERNRRDSTCLTHRPGTIGEHLVRTIEQRDFLFRLIRPRRHRNHQAIHLHTAFFKVVPLPRTYKSRGPDVQ